VTPNPSVVVKPSLPRMFAALALSNLGGAGALFLVCGMGWVFATLFAAFVVGSALLFLLAALSGRPEVQITEEGFVCRTAFQSQPYGWSDIDGEFVAMRVGILKMVVFRLAPAYKERGGSTRWPPCPGYDAAISGAYQLSMEQLADVLNRHRQRALVGTAETSGTSTSECQETALPSPTQASEAEDNGSAIARVAAGLLAVLFAAAPFMATDGKLDLTMAVVMIVMACMFGWYAVCGKSGMPQWLK